MPLASVSRDYPQCKWFPGLVLRHYPFRHKLKVSGNEIQYFHSQMDVSVHYVHAPLEVHEKKGHSFIAVYKSSGNKFNCHEFFSGSTTWLNGHRVRQVASHKDPFLQTQHNLDNGIPLATMTQAGIVMTFFVPEKQVTNVNSRWLHYLCFVGAAHTRGLIKHFGDWHCGISKKNWEREYIFWKCFFLLVCFCKLKMFGRYSVDEIGLCRDILGIFCMKKEAKVSSWSE
jgi:hypothetical protein